MVFLKIISGLLTPLIAILTAYIAYQQYRTNKDKLRFELYQKRLEVYEGLSDLIGFIIRTGKITMSEIQKYTISINKSFFLFDSNLNTYLEKIRSNCLELDTTLFELQDADKEERKKLIKKKFELIKWVIDQTKESKKKFGKYLRITT